ncbi:MAG: ribbon-helix-helix protein, CopG family [Vicinamibacterales bacterium]
MKAIQITVDERLLAQLDADPDVKRDGRSAVLRRAAEAYLQRRRQERTARAYRHGYGQGSNVEKEFEGWPEEGMWLER